MEDDRHRAITQRNSVPPRSHWTKASGARYREPKQSSEGLPTLLENLCRVSLRSTLHFANLLSALDRLNQNSSPSLPHPVLVPLAAHAQGAPFDNGFTAWQALFTRTVANVASLFAILIGGYQFAHGGPGGKTALAGVGAGTDIAVLAAKRSDLPLARLAEETNSERSYPYPIEP
jgi:hypothetical protein